VTSWHPICILKGMLLDKLHSGFLLFETRQGSVRVELSLQQRIYLLWTFRHFRQLSIPLLNSRQRTLVNDLFRHHAELAPDSHNPSLVIGVVEGFVPPTAPPIVPMEVPITAWPIRKPAQEPVQQPVQVEVQEEEPQEAVIAQPREITLQPDPVPAASSKFVWPAFALSRLTTSRLTTSKLTTSNLTVSGLTSRLTMSRPIMSRPTMSRLATTVGALSLCIISVGAWHRIQVIPASQAHNQTRLQQINAIAAPDAHHPAEPAALAENATAPVATAQITAAPDTNVMRASIAADVPVHTPAHISTPVPTPRRMIRVHHSASTPPGTLSGQSMGIQASRPPLRFAYPVYTDVRARGVVSLTAGVDSDGAVRNVRVVSGNHALAAAAVRAVRQWRYRPYLKDGQPVATETNIVISFFSPDAISMSFPPRIPASH